MASLMTRAPLNWPIRSKRPERKLARVVGVLVVALIAAISGVLVLRGYLKQQASVHFSQQQLDSIWLQSIDEAKTGGSPNSERNQAILCDMMRRIANGARPALGSAVPSRSVAQKYGAELCTQQP